MRSESRPAVLDARSGEHGSATLIAVLIMALLGIFVTATLSRATNGILIMNNDLANTQAFYQAQSSLEQMTVNFDNIFTFRLTPLASDITAVTAVKPSVPGYTFAQSITETNTSETPHTIASGPFAGLTSYYNQWQLDATATSTTGASVHLTRQFYNHEVPVFQFGIFYDGPLAIHPGPVMYFSGRVHSNGNIYMLSGANVYFTSPVTAAGQVIRDWNRNGATAASNWTGLVWVANPAGTYEQLNPLSGTTSYGSANSENLTAGHLDTTASTIDPEPGWTANSAWAADSTVFGGNLSANVPKLLLPIQTGLTPSGVPQSPIQLIKRGISSSDYQNTVLGVAADDSITYSSRYCNKQGIRVSLGDSQAELPGGTGGLRLDGDSTGTNASDTDSDGSRGYKPAAMTDGYQATRLNGMRLYTGASYSDNGNSGGPSPNTNLPHSGATYNRQTWIKVEIVNINSAGAIVTTDITADFLSLGMTSVAPDLLNSAGTASLGDSRAILKMQRYEIPGAPVRVADVNVADGTNPNTAVSAPTTANFIYNVPGTTNLLPIGPYNVFTYQAASGSVGQFNYVSMTNNNYSPSMAGAYTGSGATPSSGNMGFSVLTNLHKTAAGTLYVTASQLSNTGVATPGSVAGSTVQGTNLWGQSHLPALGGTPGSALPVTVSGFTSNPTYPAAYNLNGKITIPSYTFNLASGAGGTHTFTMKYNGGSATSTITYSSTASTMVTNLQTALSGLANIGSGNVLVTSAGGGQYNVYLPNPASVTPGLLTFAAATGMTIQTSATGSTITPGSSGYTATSNEVFGAFTLSAASNQTFKLTFAGQTTSAITYVSNNSTTTATNIQTALAALTSIGAGNVTVTGSGTNPQTFNVTISMVPGNASPNALGFTSVAGQTVTPSASLTAGLAPGQSFSSLQSIEAGAFGVSSLIKASTQRTETVVPFPIEMFDTREGLFNDDMVVSGTAPAWDSLYANGAADKTANGGTAAAWAGADLPANGVMSMIDVDVANMRTFLSGGFDGTFPNGLTASQIPTNPGWILYISDRRGDRDDDGEYDQEAIYANSDGTLSGVQGGTPIPGEDANLNGVLDVDTTWEAPPYTATVPADIAAFFDHQYFRRGVRLINGTELPGDNTDGFTLASENGVYVLGNYNADLGTANSTYGIATGTEPAGGAVPTPPIDYVPSAGYTPAGSNIVSKANPVSVQVPASIAADAVYILSNAWKDGNSFRNPYTMDTGNSKRQATETTVRAALFMGSAQGSIKVTGQLNQGGSDACLDGGVHNFPRFLEDWGGVYFNYCGSLVDPFNSRVAIGAHKTGGSAGVYSPPNRNWTFDTSFLTITRLPPGTPLFQFIQTTGFRWTTAQEN